MRFSSSLAALAVLSRTISAQGSGSLEPKEGYKTTDIFLPFATNGSYIAVFGSSGNPTTWWYAEDEAQLTDPPKTFTLGPTRMVYSESTTTVTQIAKAVYQSASLILNCSYTSTSSEPGKTAWRVTAACSETTAFVNNVTGTLRVDGFTLPEFYRPTVTERPAGVAPPTASSDGGWVGVYVQTDFVQEGVSGAEETGMPTSTQGGVERRLRRYLRRLWSLLLELLPSLYKYYPEKECSLGVVTFCYGRSIKPPAISN